MQDECHGMQAPSDRRAWTLVLLFLAGALSAGCAAQSKAPETRPPVLLNHIMVTVRAETYEALTTSRFLRSFVHADEGTVVRPDVTYRGFYLFGLSTYLEIFPPGGADKVVWRDTFVALGVEVPGALEALAKTLTFPSGQKVKVERTYFRIGTQDVPWFRYVAFNYDHFSAEVMEREPTFLDARDPGTPHPAPLSQEAGLAKFYAPDLMLSDVVGATICLDSVEARDFAALLLASGWSLSGTLTEGTWSGPDASITVMPAGERRGLAEVKMRLNRLVETQRIQLGDSTLVLQGDIATWVLNAHAARTDTK
jgi:Family of unknown function (DUF5829)